MVGVGMTPPKVDGAAKPTSSVIMSNTLGAPFGGTTRGGPPGFDSDAFSLITPPNCGGWRRKLLSVDRGRGAGRTWDTCDLLSQCRDTTKGEKTRSREQYAATELS